MKKNYVENLPLEIINQYQSVATNVFNCAIHNQHNIYIIHGPRLEQEHKERLPIFSESFSEQNYYIP